MSWSGLLELGSKGAGSVLSFLGGIKTTLIAAAVTGAIAFGAGYYVGNDHVVKEYIHASVQEISKARQEGVKAQADQDAKDWAATKQDYETRLLADRIREDALKADLLHWKSLVPHDPKCIVPAAAMQGLNDPKLIGEDAQ